MSKRLWIILGSLFVAGVVVAGVLYVTFPVADDDLRRHGSELFQVLERAGRHVEHGNESRLQSPGGGGVAFTSKPTPFGRTLRAGDWPSYNRTPSSQRLLAARPDQHQECRAT